MIYSETVLDHFHHPRNAGEIAEATAVVEARNPVCGDVLKLWVLLDGERIVRARFKAEGCVPAVACASWLSDWMQGKSVDELKGLSAARIELALGGLPTASRHASQLAADAVRKLFPQLR